MTECKGVDEQEELAAKRRLAKKLVKIALSKKQSGYAAKGGQDKIYFPSTKGRNGLFATKRRSAGSFRRSVLGMSLSTRLKQICRTPTRRYKPACNMPSFEEIDPPSINGDKARINFPRHVYYRQTVPPVLPPANERRNRAPTSHEGR